jgi:transcription factor E
MQVKLLYDLVEEMAGEGSGRIVEILFGKKDVNEFLIAKKMELTINQVRNILYKLSADGLVTFVRKKDKRKGWYIYYWTLKTEKCLVKLEDSLLRRIDDLGSKLNNRETKCYYVCKGCDIEVSEEKALESGFTCDECIEVYELADNTKNIRDIKGKTTKTQKDLDLIREELVALREKEAKKRARAAKKEAKEKDEKAEMLKKARAAARKKVAAKKKVVKKKVTKKTVKKVVKKATKKVAKKVVKKAAKKVAKKTVKKVTKKTTKRANILKKIKKAVKGK